MEMKPYPVDVVQFVCEHYKQPCELVVSKSRKAELIVPRHMSMYLIFELSEITKSTIGRFFGTNYTKVISAIKRIEDDFKLFTEYKNLKEKINARISEENRILHSDSRLLDAQEYWRMGW
jgi:chromosomal replication initiator protein